MQIIRLQEGNDAARVYCLPTATGSIHSYSELANAVGPGYSIYGVQLTERDANGKYREYASLPEMAAAIVPGLLAHHRDAPICLIGYSFAACLAIELAQQLIALGKFVPLLAIIDKSPPASSLAPLLRLKHFVRHAAPFVLRLLRSSLSDATQRRSYRDAIVYRVRGKHFIENADWYHSLTDERRAYVTKNIANLRSYRFKGTYPGNIILFRLPPAPGHDIHPLRFHQLADYGWSEATRTNVDVVHAPGDHGSIMAQPDVALIADALRRALSRVKLGSDES